MGTARATFTITPQGKQEIARFKMLRPRLIASIKNLLRKTAVDIHHEIVVSMKNTPKSGTSYKKKGGRTHIASSPGNAPAIDSGNFISQILNFKEEESGSEFFVGALKHTPKYPIFLETGTRNMKPRPWLSPAVENNLKGFDSKIRAAIEKAS